MNTTLVVSERVRTGAGDQMRGTAPDKKRARGRARNEALPDAIVVAALVRGSRLTREDIPSKLIAAKRLLMLIRRELRRLNRLDAQSTTLLT